jgi:hypothetical protein
VSDLLAQLQEPTPFRVKPGEVRFFPSGKGGTYKARALPYIDRVTVLARLNEVLGEGWRSDFQVIDTVAKVVQCRLEIRTPEGWIGRADIGGPGEPGESPTTEWKSAATDALKRYGSLARARTSARRSSSNGLTTLHMPSGRLSVCNPPPFRRPSPRTMPWSASGWLRSSATLRPLTSLPTAACASMGSQIPGSYSASNSRR